MQRQGREKEAQTIYNQVLRSKPADIGLVAVASNNLIAINKDQNIFDSKKRIKAATVEGLDQKLTSAQREAIARNNALLAMYTAQVEICRELLASLDTATLHDKELIMAGALSKAGRHEDAVKILASGVEADPVILLTSAHILLSAGETGRAVALLGKLPPDWKFRVGVLSSLVCLHLAKDDKKAAADLLKSAVDWNKKSGSKSSGMAVVWRKTAEFHLKTGEAAVAAESLEQLQQLEPSLTTLSQLVLAYAKFDLKKGMEVSKKLVKTQALHAKASAADTNT